MGNKTMVKCDQFKAALRAVVKVLPPIERGKIALDGFRLIWLRTLPAEGVVVLGARDRSSLEITLPTSGGCNEFSVAVNGEHLLEIIEAVRAEDVSFSLDDSTRLVVSVPHGAWHIATAQGPGKMSVEPPPSNQAPCVTIPAGELLEMITAVKSLMCNEEYRPQIYGIRLEEHEGWLSAHACDGWAYARMTAHTSADVTAGFGVTICRDAIPSLEALLPLTWDDVKMWGDEGGLVLKASSWVARVSCSTGKWPDATGLIRPAVEGVTVKKNDLIGLCVMAQGAGRFVDPLGMRLWTEGGRLVASVVGNNTRGRWSIPAEVASEMEVAMYQPILIKRALCGVEGDKVTIESSGNQPMVISDTSNASWVGGVMPMTP